jgi:hypothetical protein
MWTGNPWIVGEPGPGPIVFDLFLQVLLPCVPRRAPSPARPRDASAIGSRTSPLHSLIMKFSAHAILAALPAATPSQPRCNHPVHRSYYYYYYCFSATLSPLENFVGFLLLNCMDLQGPLRDVGSSNPNEVSSTNPPAVGTEFRIQQSSISLAPFVQGFPQVGSQMSFLFPHSFMPPIPGVGFAPTTQGGPSATIDLTVGAQ